ncbi:uncharacterized protein LOC143143263 [Ptiloglossa arizonensis]|uniref:uncharacterized protein LOC143143263 n=1 Tax=Ptiloglossa arizonensis TaxID=3350558 RepID=UPI003F9F9AF0
MTKKLKALIKTTSSHLKIQFPRSRTCSYPFLFSTLLTIQPVFVAERQTIICLRRRSDPLTVCRKITGKMIWCIDDPTLLISYASTFGSVMTIDKGVPYNSMKRRKKGSVTMSRR